MIAFSQVESLLFGCLPACGQAAKQQRLHLGKSSGAYGHSATLVLRASSILLSAFYFVVQLARDIALGKLNHKRF